MLDSGVRDAHLIHNEMKQMIDEIDYAKIDYIQIVNARTPNRYSWFRAMF